MIERARDIDDRGLYQLVRASVLYRSVHAAGVISHIVFPARKFCHSSRDCARWQLSGRQSRLGRRDTDVGAFPIIDIIARRQRVESLLAAMRPFVWPGSARMLHRTSGGLREDRVAS